MSSSRALRDITEKHGGTYQASAVGEVNVVELMKKLMQLLVAKVMVELFIHHRIMEEIV